MAFDAFLRAHTQVVSPDLCPEISLHLAGDLDAMWARQEAWLGRAGLPTPFWCVAWIGGQALARYTLDHPMLVCSRSVLDLGSGSGICAIAAAKAGADSVEASDVDPFFPDVL